MMEILKGIWLLIGGLVGWKPCAAPPLKPMKISELLTDESKWTQGSFACNADGEECPETSKHAAQWCLLGAIERCYKDPDERRRITLSVAEHLRGKDFGRLPLCYGNVSQSGLIIRWNDDDKRRTFSDVRSLITELDI